MRATLGVVLGLLAFLVACSANPGPHDVNGGGLESYYSEELTDWVSFADQISVVRVVSERAVAASPDDIAGGLDKQFRNRIVHAVVERNLWTAPRAPQLRTEFDLDVAGWSIDNKGRPTPATLERSLRLEPGDRVVLPITRDSEGGVDILSPHAVVPVSGTLHGSQTNGNLDPAVQVLKGKTMAEMVAILSRTKPDPIAAKHMDLSPHERQELVARHRYEQRMHSGSSR